MSLHVERLVVMLGMIPRAPRKITVKELVFQLQERGFSVPNTRLVERNLQDLRDSPSFPLDNDGHKPAGWSWDRDAQLFDMPGMDQHTALTFLLVEQFIAGMLPRSTRGFLQPHVNKAREVMKAGGRKLSTWPRKIAILPKGQPLVTPQVKDAVIEVVYEALLQERRFIATYKKRDAARAKSYRVNPLGLVFRNDQIYLVCLLDQHPEPRQLVLHRMQRAELLDEAREIPKGFDLDVYVKRGGFHYSDADQGVLEIDLALRVNKEVYGQLQETRLSPEQSIKDLGDGWFELRARVTQDRQLWWWLLSFGSQVQVLEPSSLRDKFIKEIKQMAKNYRDL